MGKRDSRARRPKLIPDLQERGNPAAFPFCCLLFFAKPDLQNRHT